jgi:hypothetical protein
MAKGKKAIVLTHHTPTYRIRGTSLLAIHPAAMDFQHSALVTGSGLAFSSSLEYMFKNKGTNVAVWAHGHTHYNDDKIIGTHTRSNPTLIIRSPDHTSPTQRERGW